MTNHQVCPVCSPESRDSRVVSSYLIVSEAVSVGVSVSEREREEDGGE